MKKVLLYSGGLDSWLIDKLWNPDLKLYIDIEGRYSNEEIKRLPEDVKVIKFPLGEYEQPSAFIPMRNLYFLMLGSNYGDNICLGATEGDKGSKDKTEEFLIKAEEMMNYLSGKQSKVLEDRKIEVCKEFIHKYKNDLIEEYLKIGGQIEKAATGTFSCHFPDNEEECFNCKPCFRKFCLMEYYGYKYPQERRIKMFRYIRKKIVPRSKNLDGTYYSERGTEGIICAEVVKRMYEEFGGSIEEDEGK